MAIKVICTQKWNPRHCPNLLSVFAWSENVRVYLNQTLFGQCTKISRVMTICSWKERFGLLSILKILSIGERVWNNSGWNQSVFSSFCHSHSFSNWTLSASVFTFLFWIILISPVPSTTLVPNYIRNIYSILK